jgi:hypothetical protein
MADPLGTLLPPLLVLAQQIPKLKPSVAKPYKFSAKCNQPYHEHLEDIREVTFELNQETLEISVTCKQCGHLAIEDILHPKPKPENPHKVIRQPAILQSLIHLLPIDSISVDTRAQSRVEIDTDLVKEYCEAMKAGAVFPPMVVYQDSDSAYWLSEGFHRIAAYRQAEITECPCTIKNGDLRDAILNSCGSNAEHGKRRTNADKHHAVEIMLADADWNQFSDREIAKQCVVSHEFVRKIRTSVESSICQPLTDIANRIAKRGGKTYTMNISKVKPTAKPKQPEPAATTEPVQTATTVEPTDSARLIAEREATKKAQDDAWLDSFYKFSEIAASYCNEHNAQSMRKKLLEKSEYYGDRWKRSVEDSVGKLMKFLDNKDVYVTAINQLLDDLKSAKIEKLTNELAVLSKQESE